MMIFHQFCEFMECSRGFQASFRERKLSSHERVICLLSASPGSWRHREDKEEINTEHNAWDPAQTPQPEAISPSLLWPWNDHSLLLFSHLHWEDQAHTKLIVPPQTGDSHWFSLRFSKHRKALFNRQRRLPFLHMVGMHKGTLGKKGAVTCLITCLCAWARTEKGISPYTTVLYCWRADQPCNIHRLVYLQKPFSLPRVLMLISDNSWWGSTVSWPLWSLILWREEQMCCSQAAVKSWSGPVILSEVIGEESVILTQFPCTPCQNWGVATDQLPTNSFIDMTNVTSA